MKTKFFWAALSLFLLSACGPMIGGIMVASNGIKDFKVAQGSLSTLKAGSHVAVLGPFDKTAKAFYICRGEEAAAFATEFNQAGLFSAELAIDTRFPEKLPTVSQFKGRTKAEVQTALELKNSPDIIMSGTILSREMVAAPANGVIMTAVYRLEFLNLADGQITVIQINAKELFQDVIPAAVKHLAKQMGKR